MDKIVQEYNHAVRQYLKAFHADDNDGMLHWYIVASALISLIEYSGVKFKATNKRNGKITTSSIITLP